MASSLPDGDPAPADGSLTSKARQAVGRQPLGIYLHVPFCATRCGYCDFNTYTADELGPGAAAADVRRHRAGRAPAGRRACSATRRPRRWRPCSSAAARRRCCPRRTWPPAARRSGSSVSRPTPRSPPRRTPTRSTPAVAGGAARGGLHPGQLRHAVRRPARARDPRADAHPRPGRRGRRLGACGRLHAGQPRPHLRDAGGVRRRLAATRWTSRSSSRPTTSRPTR